ncbi:MAG: permease-like cell division protein FtsX [Clostridiales bacterium]|nr:permease-like cell division protein FtsX [Clostridiales bacterium]
MKFRSIKYFFSEAFGGVVRNRLMSVASIGTVAACIFIITICYCALTNVDYMLEQVEESIGIAVFLDEGLNSDKILEINDALVSLEHVESVSYISPDDALNDLKESLDAEELLAGFDETNNPLSSSFEVNLDDIAYQSETVDQIKLIDGVRNIRSSESETQILVKISNFVGIFGVVLILVLAAISVVIITNTIKLSVFTRRTEISIMKYVGATDWFIRWPFVIEGIIIGIVGAAIPMIVAWPLYNKLVDVIYEQIPMITSIVSFKFGIDIFSVLLPGSLLFGALLGVLGSTISLRKHLDV